MYLVFSSETNSHFLVVFLENEILYGHSFPVSDEVLKDDFIVPIGKCKIERWVRKIPERTLRCLHIRLTRWVYRSGDHVTIVSFSKGVELSLEAAKQLEALGVSAEVSTNSHYFTALGQVTN